MLLCSPTRRPYNTLKCEIPFEGEIYSCHFLYLLFVRFSFFFFIPSDCCATGVTLPMGLSLSEVICDWGEILF